jgi:PEGA domain-containing protein
VSGDPPYDGDVSAVLALTILAKLVQGADEDNAITPISIIEEAERAAGFFPDLNTIPQSALRTEDCGTDVSCIARVLSMANVDLALEIVLNRQISPAVLTMRLIDAHDAAAKRSAVDDVGDDPRKLSPAVHRMVTDLLEGYGRPAGGRVTIETLPPDALLSIENAGGPQAASLKNAYTLAPGTYLVIAARDGYAERRERVTIERGQETHLSLTLEERSIASSPWFWAAIGGALVAGAAAAYLILRPTERAGLFCETRDLRNLGSCQ